jgi:signal transduction histidine kinase
VNPPITPTEPEVSPTVPSISNPNPALPECNPATGENCQVNPRNDESEESAEDTAQTGFVTPQSQDTIQAGVRPLSQLAAFSTRLQASIKQFARSVPFPIVAAFPYLIMLMLLALMAYYLYQSQKQLRREDRLRKLYKQQEVLAEEKRNFLELTSHYLRTPLTYIKAGSEMLLRSKQNDILSSELAQSVGHLGLFVESLIEEASKNEQLEKISVPKRKIWSPLTSRAFLAPVLGFGATLGVFYLIFGVIGGIEFGVNRYVTQLLALFIIVQLFYAVFKNGQNIKQEQATLTETINRHTNLDHARTKLIKDAGEQLMTRTRHLATIINKFEKSDTSKTVMQQGVDRLNELAQAFSLVSNLENDILKGQSEPVSVRRIAAEVIEPLAEKIRAKKIKVEVSGFEDNINLSTNRKLAELTLKTLLENALQASKEGSSIIVKCLHSEDRVAFQVIDHGEGIPKDKLERLFKPFVRVGPVTTFNREGIGLSLYLDRLIMHSLGGEVEIVSRFKHGTTSTITFNQKAAS